MLRNQRKATKL
jgi:hypothetical protein